MWCTSQVDILGCIEHFAFFCLFIFLAIPFFLRSLLYVYVTDTRPKYVYRYIYPQAHVHFYNDANLTACRSTKIYKTPSLQKTQSVERPIYATGGFPTTTAAGPGMQIYNTGILHIIMQQHAVLSERLVPVYIERDLARVTSSEE